MSPSSSSGYSSRSSHIAPSSIATRPEVGEQSEVAGGLHLVVVVDVGHRELEPLDDGHRERRLGGGADIGEQQADVAAGHPSQHEEVLVDAHHADGPDVGGQLAERVHEHVELGRRSRREAGHGPVAVFAVGSYSEVDGGCGLGIHRVHTSMVTDSGTGGESRCSAGSEVRQTPVRRHARMA